MNPNEIQVGGTHYRSTFQHWDLVVRLRLGYFEGQITKYVTRHRSKNGKQDLDKALHFLMKLMALVQENGWQATHLYPTVALMDEYAITNKLVHHEQDVINFVCRWENIDQLKLAEQALMKLMGAYYEPAPGLTWPVVCSDEERLARLEGSAPGASYVDQG